MKDKLHTKGKTSYSIIGEAIEVDAVWYTDCVGSQYWAFRCVCTNNKIMWTFAGYTKEQAVKNCKAIFGEKFSISLKFVGK